MPRQPQRRPAGGQREAASGSVERAEWLLHRLESAGERLATAAEELERLLPRLPPEPATVMRERVASLCNAWSRPLPRGVRADAWLVLVPAVGAAQLAGDVAALLRDEGRPAAQRCLACRALGALRTADACSALRSVLEQPGDPAVRAAAAQALADARDVEAEGLLERLLEERLPRALWNGVATALEQLRTMP